MGYCFEPPHVLIELSEKLNIRGIWPNPGFVVLYPGSLDAEFTEEQDRAILADADPMGQWWNETTAAGSDKIRVNYNMHAKQFQSYMHTVSVCTTQHQFFRFANECRYTHGLQRTLPCFRNLYLPSHLTRSQSVLPMSSGVVSPPLIPVVFPALIPAVLPPHS